jgi:hypothetical protein
VAATLLVLAMAAVLLFARLGHYSLWDDEAGTALDGEGVWRTGDTTALVGHNIVAFRNGMDLRGIKTRYESPLQSYVVAPFAGTWPGSALAVRVPFAAVGFLTVLLILWWMHRDKVSTCTWILIAMGLVANVSFWLYCRQCRYYSLTIFLSVAVAYLYLHYENRWWVPALIGVASVALFASNYLSYAALYSAIGLDWLIWGRERFRPGWRGWMWIWTPQVLLNVPIFWIWCPLGMPSIDPSRGRAVTNHLVLFWWFLRDMDSNEFGVMLLLLAAPLLWFWRRERWLLRAPLAAMIFVAVISIASPQKTWLLDPAGHWSQLASLADVRYLCPLIPLLIVIAAIVLESITPSRLRWLAIPLGAFVFFTSAAHFGPLFEPAPFNYWSARSTPVLYAEELLDPPGDPYSAAAEWINQHVSEGKSIVVVPDYMCYPLMYHAPKAVYAWQFKPDKRAEYPMLPAIDFQWAAAPDYVIVFGNAWPPRTGFPLAHQDYLLVADLNVYGHDMFRPELFSRTFTPITGFNPMVDGIRIYERIGPAAAPRAPETK